MFRLPDFSVQKRKLRPGLTRRSHKKTRAGCLTCKFRRVRCSGERPSCHNCLHRDSICSYLSTTVVLPATDLAKNPPRLLPQPVLLASVNEIGLIDLRLMHQFLTLAYPHLPAGNDSIWTTQVPQIAHHHTYLMHAILALGASHLHRINPDPSYHTTAVSHRGHAIAGLNDAIAKTHSAPDENDAMLAAAYALTFQSQYMEDGLIDFVTMVRGCALITKHIQSSQTSTSFSLHPDAYVSTLEPDVSSLPPIDPDILTTGLRSLSFLCPILRSSTELAFFFALKRTLVASLSSTRDGFARFADIFSIWFDSTSDDFNELIDPTNHTAKVLLAYFMVVQLLMAPVTMPMYKPPKRAADITTTAVVVLVDWTRKICEGVPRRMRVFLGWPEAVLAMVVNDIKNGNSEMKFGAGPVEAPSARNISGYLPR